MLGGGSEGAVGSNEDRSEGCGVGWGLKRRWDLFGGEGGDLNGGGGGGG